MLVAHVSEPWPARHCLATGHATAHVQLEASFRGSCGPRRCLVRNLTLSEHTPLLALGNAASVLAAEPAVARPSTGACAARIGTHAGPACACFAASGRGSHEYLFGSGCNR